MKPAFWKLSQGKKHFTFSDILQSIDDRLVYIHKDSASIGGSEIPQSQNFIEATIGDYFYLTHGNEGIYLLGQFTGPVNYFSEWDEGWYDRPFRIITRCGSGMYYEGPSKWWTPNNHSTFVKVPETEIGLFEELILKPFFEINLSNFGL